MILGENMITSDRFEGMKHFLIFHPTDSTSGTIEKTQREEIYDKIPYKVVNNTDFVIN